MEWIPVALGFAVALLLIRVRTLERKLDRLSRVEAKLDALVQHAGITFDPFRDVPPAVAEALAHGQMILAVKRYREAMGTDLKTAKEAVDEIRRRSAAL